MPSDLALMLWASDEKEAAGRALEKALFMDPQKSALYFMLINLRFSRVQTAQNWFVNYMDRVNPSNLGGEWQYLLQAYLAGAFGNYIRPESALTIGLIPHFTEAELIPVGNAAGSGARMALISRSARDETVEILSHVEYLELSGRPDFQYQFAEAMMF